MKVNSKEMKADTKIKVLQHSENDRMYNRIGIVHSVENGYIQVRFSDNDIYILTDGSEYELIGEDKEKVCCVPGPKIIKQIKIIYAISIKELEEEVNLFLKLYDGYIGAITFDVNNNSMYVAFIEYFKEVKDE